MDTFDRPTVSQVAAIRTEDHVVWDEPGALDAGRLDLRFIASTWLLSMLATVAIFAVTVPIVMLLSDRSLTGETGSELGVLTILAAMSTFIGFVTVVSARLVRVEHDRVVNSLAVAALHVALAAILLGAELLLRAAGDASISDLWSGPASVRVGNAFTVLERSSVAACIACLLAIGMVPARGERPDGTQTERTDSEHML